MASRPLRLEDPRRLGNYQLLSRLGEGGMGTVFLGRDPAGRHVAVKAIRREYADDEEFRARFRSEVNRARQVPSFCTAAVLDADPDNDIPYLVVEYVDGPSLHEVVTEQGPISPGDLHSVAVGVAAALTAIHGAGVIHRDLKPTNVLLSLGLPKVIDFGIARALEATSQHTRTDHFVGTMAYMAPERLDPEAGQVTPAADIFAWGAVVAYAGTGRSPFGGATPLATATNILTRPPDLSGMPDTLIEPLERALTKDPRGRPTANELVQELLAASAPRPVLPTGGKPRQDTGRFDARRLFEQLIAEGPGPTVPATPAANQAASFPSRAAAPGAPFPDRAAARRAPSPDRVAGRGPLSPDRVAGRGPLSPDRAVGPVAPVPGNAPGKSGIRGFVLAVSPAKPAVRRLVLALVALLVAVVAGAIVAYARSTGNPRPTTLRATATASTTILSGRGPSYFDALSAPGRFREGSADNGHCQFRDGQLQAWVNGRSTYQCPGPSDMFAGDQSIAVDISLASARACAMIWFRYQETRSYQLTACAGQVELEQLDGAILTAIGQADVRTLQPGARHRVSIVIATQNASVTIDGALTLAAAVTSVDLESGRILLGATSAGSASAAGVSFANLDVRSG